MSYVKLFLPVAVAFIVLLSFIEKEQEDLNLIVGILVKGGLLLYYLRLENSRTPLVNNLTAAIVIMMIGEYLINTGNVVIGKAIFSLANIGFAILYFLRQAFKPRKDELKAIKNVAVGLYCLGNILSISAEMGAAPASIGGVFIFLVYIYDRLMKVNLS